MHGFLTCSLQVTADVETSLNLIRKSEYVERTEPSYLFKDTIPVIVGSSISVGFVEKATKDDIDGLIASYGLEITGRSPSRSSVYYLGATDKTAEDILTLANRIHESELTRYAQPIISAPVSTNGYMAYDYYNEYQWHIKKVIGDFNQASVWDFARLGDTALSDTIIAAVLDDGLVNNHTDLPASRVLPGHDYADGDGDVTPNDYAGHGMACAGIIAASHSTDPADSAEQTSGVISMAPMVKIWPGKVFQDDRNCGPLEADTVFSNAIDDAWNVGHADVINCSWNYWLPSSEINDAIHGADSVGRYGKGSVVVFSSDNSWTEPGTVGYSARHPDALAVGAIDSQDSIYPWSCYDSTLDLVAPSGAIPAKGLGLAGDMWTLDQPDYQKGYNPNAVDDCPSINDNDDDFVCAFGGTSGAAPIVSGAAALVITFDTTLTSAEVRDILKKSAVTDLDWTNGTPIDTPHVQYGYGRVDAYRAILSLARGDMNADGHINLADITILQNYIYYETGAPFPDTRLANCDCDSLGNANLADITRLIDFVYISHDPLPVPCYNWDYPDE